MRDVITTIIKVSLSYKILILKQNSKNHKNRMQHHKTVYTDANLVSKYIFFILK